MNRIMLLLAVAGLVFFLVTPAILAEELSADDYVEFWKPLVGSWKTTAETDGKTEPGTFSFRLARNEKCYILYSEGAGFPATQQLQGYDPGTKKAIAPGFTDAGSFQIQTMLMDGMKKGMKAAKGVGGTWEKKVFAADGKASTLVCKWTFLQVDENQVVVHWFEGKEDGSPIPDLNMTMVRVTERLPRSQTPSTAANGASQNLAATDYIGFWKPLEGSWQGAVESDGKSIETSWRMRLSRNGKCFVTSGTGGGYPANQTIDGYDPVAKKWTVVGFDADGAFSIDTCQLNDMQKGKRVGKGGIGKGEAKRFTREGQTVTTTYTLSCEELSENKASFVWSERKEDGQAKPDDTWTAERQPERERGTR